MCSFVACLRHLTGYRATISRRNRGVGGCVLGWLLVFLLGWGGGGCVFVESFSQHHDNVQR